MLKVIGLSGRKECGKSEIAKIFEKYGYKRISFATPLKIITAHIAKCKVDDINSLKNVVKNYVLSDDDKIYLSSETGIDLSFIEEKLNNKVLPTIRDIMQYVGTDVIRASNENWHVNKIKNIILQSKDNFIIDDVRFSNELNMIHELNGDSWFIIRPIINNVSNHKSENSLTWRDTKYVFINNISLQELRTRWDNAVRFEYTDKEPILPILSEKTDELFKSTDKQFAQYKNNEIEHILSLFLLTHPYEVECNMYNMKWSNIESHGLIEQNGEIYAIVQIDDLVFNMKTDNALFIEDSKILL